MSDAPGGPDYFSQLSEWLEIQQEAYIYIVNSSACKTFLFVPLNQVFIFILGSSCSLSVEGKEEKMGAALFKHSFV